MNAGKNCRAFAIWAFSLAFLVSFTSRSVAEDRGSKLYLQGLKSTVLIIAVVKDSIVAGSGSLVNAREGHILTNWHIAPEGSEIIVLFPIWEKGRPVAEADRYFTKEARKNGLAAKLVVSDSKVDLAVIKLAEPTKVPADAQAVTFANDSPVAGGKIFSIGNPGVSDALWILTPGEIRQVYQKKWTSGAMDKRITEHDSKVIEATSPISIGDSGGPCFNDKGEQIGVTQGALRASVAQGFGYFIDVSEARTFLKAKKIEFKVAVEPMEVKKDAPR